MKNAKAICASVLSKSTGRAVAVVGFAIVATQFVACDNDVNCSKFGERRDPDNFCECAPPFVEPFEDRLDDCICPVGYMMNLREDDCIPIEADGGMTDAARDSGIPDGDAFVASCAEPSDCPERDNATRTCESGTCGFDCNPDWGDCDTNATNGCEADLRRLFSSPRIVPQKSSVPSLLLEMWYGTFLGKYKTCDE